MNPMLCSVTHLCLEITPKSVASITDNTLAIKTMTQISDTALIAEDLASIIDNT